MLCTHFVGILNCSSLCSGRVSMALTKLIFDDGNLLAMLLPQNVVDQGSLTRSKEPYDQEMLPEPHRANARSPSICMIAACARVVMELRAGRCGHELGVSHSREKCQVAFLAILLRHLEARAGVAQQCKVR